MISPKWKQITNLPNYLLINGQLLGVMKDVLIVHLNEK